MEYRGEDWTGTIGTSWAAEWVRTDRTFAPLTARLVAAVGDALPVPSPDVRPRVLDIGCGAGETALAIGRARPDIDVTGLDLAPDLIAAAADRKGDTGNCRFVIGDAASWRDGQPFDAALSRHGVMFFDVPVAAFAHLRSLLRSGASLTFTCFRARDDNEWARCLAALLHLPPSDTDLPGPFAFASRDKVSAILRDAGWRDATVEPVDYDYVPGAGDDPVADAAGFFARIGPAAPAIRALTSDDRAAFDTKLRQLLERHVDGGCVRFDAAAWLWRATA